LKTAPVLFLVALWCTSFPRAAAQQDRLVVKGDGSTFAYRMYSKWIDQFEKNNPGLHFTYVSNGSGAGVHDIMYAIRCKRDGESCGAPLGFVSDL
jgi:ABC-type phosphate transport system substrate-binding protein